MTTLHRIAPDLSVRIEPGHAVLLRWHQDDQLGHFSTEIARLSLKQLGELVCLASEGWAELCHTDQALRALQVANIIGGCP